MNTTTRARSESSKVTHNSLFLFSSRALDILSIIISSILIAKYLGVALFGEYAFLMAYVVSIVMIAYMGLDNIGIRELARHKDRAGEYLGNIIIARWGLLLLALAILLAVYPFMGIKSSFIPAIIFIAASKMVEATASSLIIVFRAFERIQYEVLITVFWRLSSLALIIIAVYLDWWLTGIALALFLASLLQVGASFYLVRTRFVRPRFMINREIIRPIFKDAFIVGIAIMLSNWYLRSAQVALRFLRGPESVAFFQIAQSMIVNSGMIALSISISVYPMLARFSKSPDGGDEKAADLYARTSRLLLCISLVIAVTLAVLSRDIIFVLYGSEFALAARSLRVLSLAVVPLFITSFNSFFFISYHKHRLFAFTRMAALAAVFGGYFLLVPAYGAQGAALSFVAGLVFLVFLQAVLLRGFVQSFIKLPVLSFAGYMLYAVLVAGIMESARVGVLKILLVAATSIAMLLHFKICVRPVLVPGTVSSVESGG